MSFIFLKQNRRLIAHTKITKLVIRKDSRSLYQTATEYQDTCDMPLGIDSLNTSEHSGVMALRGDNYKRKKMRAVILGCDTLVNLTYIPTKYIKIKTSKENKSYGAQLKTCKRKVYMGIYVTKKKCGRKSYYSSMGHASIYFIVHCTQMHILLGAA